MDGRIKRMLQEIRRAIAGCTASEKATYEALCKEAEGWREQLNELIDLEDERQEEEEWRS